IERFRCLSLRRSDNLVSCKKRSLANLKEMCRKKWKSLRDTYLRERRKETEKRSGSAAGSGKKWKYSVVLSFLDPFVSPRETSGNMERGDEENQATGYEHPEDQGETEAAAAGHSETGGVLTSEKPFMLIQHEKQVLPHLMNFFEFQCSKFLSFVASSIYIHTE
uniref:MADF domain-containing protein n=1 Tax=Cyprinus carpio TaxID=7962 RepID=A0A8C2KPW8_CYPCA